MTLYNNFRNQFGKNIISYISIEVGEEKFLAQLAFEALYPGMDFDVLVKVGLLCEAEVAAFRRTYVWPFLSVDSQVVKEVVPFLELLKAFIALKNFDLSL